MRPASVLALSVIALFTGVLPAQQATRWTIRSSAAVDGRLQHELQKLAQQNNARIRFLRGTGWSPTQYSAPELGIDLSVASDTATFAAELLHNAPGSPVKPTPALAKEGYLLQVNYTEGNRPKHVVITAASAVGFHNALLRLPDVLTIERARLATALIPQPQAVTLSGEAQATIADYPSFPVRGVVEGFYGTPWTFQDRIDVLCFEGQHGMNIYFYGPKEDRYQRQLWRLPYPAWEMKRLAALVTVAKNNFVDFSFAMSPGLSISYSSDSDFRTLTAKFDSVRRLGVSNFALFLDDVPQDLVHPGDKQKFKTLAQAHIYLVNKLNRYLKSKSPDNRLTICPTTYTNEWGSRAYIKELGAGVDPGISIDWTGTTVGPSPISVQQAREWAAALHRRPLVWENFPNDDDRPWLLIFEPLRGMATGLPSEIEGMFSNPMNQAHAALISLQTVADYLWNPTGYDPNRSREHAITTQYGKDAPGQLDPLLKIYGNDGPAQSLFPQLFSQDNSPIDVPAIEAQIRELRSTVDHLRLQTRFAKIATEIASSPDQIHDQLKLVMSDSHFIHLPDGRLQRDLLQDRLQAFKTARKPVLNGEFSKWKSAGYYSLNSRKQIRDGDSLWHGSSYFSTEVALRWDESNLYIGVNVIDPHLYQPFTGRGIDKGDAVHLLIDTGLPRNLKTGRSPDVYDLYLSPGDFAGVMASVYCSEDLFPLRTNPRDYKREIETFWKQTPVGYSADIVIPAAFLGRQGLRAGDEITLSFEAQKAIPHGDPLLNDPDQIIFTSKSDRIFPIDPENPITIQQVLLLDSGSSSNAARAAEKEDGAARP